MKGFNRPTRGTVYHCNNATWLRTSTLLGSSHLSGDAIPANQPSGSTDLLYGNGS